MTKIWSRPIQSICRQKFTCCWYYAIWVVKALKTLLPALSPFPTIFSIVVFFKVVNPLPHMLMLGFSNIAEKKDMISQNMNKWEYNYLIE